MTDTDHTSAPEGTTRPAGRDAIETPALPLVTILVPAYNEALKLMSSLTAIYTYLQGLAERSGQLG